MKFAVVDVARWSSPSACGARPATLPAVQLVVLVAVAALVALGVAGCGPSTVPPSTTAGCSSVLPCAGELVCADGSCVERCTEGSCASGQCNTISGVCVECLHNEDCGPDRVCNTFTGLCGAAAVGCTDDVDCDVGNHCDTLKGACVGCLTDQHCGFGATCDLIRHVCAVAQGCTSDDQCDGQVCDPATATCVECFQGVHCASGQCDSVAHVCVAACADDDATEPNEGADAIVLSSGGEHDGHICPGDVDEFVFDAAGAVDVVVVGDGGALSVALLSPGGQQLGSGSDGVNATGLAQGRYRVVVRGTDEGITADYALRLTITTPHVCTELDTEPNNTTGAAVALPADGSLHAGQICPDDVDVWRVAVNAGDDVTITLGAGDGDAAPSLEVLSQAGAVLARGDASAAVVVNDVSAGNVFVRVSANGGEVGYTLRVTTSAAPPSCVQSDAEPNDQPAQGGALSPAVTASGQICAGDVDQWRFSANALDDAVVTLSGTGVRARVFDDGGAVLGEGTGTITLVDLAAGSYRVEVKGQLQTSEGAYGVVVALTPEPAADPCAEGGLEPDSASSARALSTDGAALNGRICNSAVTGTGNDVDFFGFAVTGALRKVGISVRFVDNDGDLDVRLKDSAGATVKTSAGVADEEFLLVDLAPGDYVVEVYGFSGAQNAYTVAASLITCTDDDFEDNDRAATAVPVSGRALQAVRCPADDDFWALRLEAGDALDARLSGSGLTMSLVSSTGVFQQADVDDGAGGRRLQASGLPAGRYALRITGSGAAQASYTLTPAITPTPSRCVDDGAEPNNGSTDAFVIDSAGLADGSYALSTLTMCEGTANTDTFFVDVPAGRTVRVALDHVTTTDLDVEVLEKRGTSALYRTLATGDAFAGVLDSVGGVMNVGGRLLVRVTEFGTQPAAGLPYGVGLEVDNAPNLACVDDRFDTWTGTTSSGTGTAATTIRFTNDDDTDADNDPSTTVAPVPLSPAETLTSLRICPDNKDYFSVSLTQGQRLVVDVDYAHSVGHDIDLHVFGPDGSVTPADADALADQLSCSTCTGVDGNEHFDATAPLAGTYFIEVFGFSSGENSYDLRVTTP
jgi:hypothetical protein